MKQYFEELIAQIKEKQPDSDELHRMKSAVARKYKVKRIPSNIEIMLHTTADDRKQLKLITKPTRTLSGVATISIMTVPHGCPHGKCTFCPGGPNSEFGDVPQSYTGREPATMRAIRNDFDSYLQVFSRLEQYAVMGQAFDKVELIIQGGTFPSLDETYQNHFLSGAYQAMNDFSTLFIVDGEVSLEKFKEFFELPGDYFNQERVDRVKDKILALKKENQRGGALGLQQEDNETAAIRCIGLTIETKPDWALIEHANRMLEQGTTRVELGIESVYEQALKLTNRGHKLEDTKRSMQILKDLGFKINAHYMLGLPGVARDDELPGLRELFESSDYKPDMIKIYPLLVIKGTPLYIQWERGQYDPMPTDVAADIISDFKQYIPKWVRIMRVNRDIPTYVTSAGIDKTNLRQYVEKLAEEKGIDCQCIRCREIGRHESGNKPEIVVTEYEASGGTEFFIAMEDEKNALYGFCRLRFPKEQLRTEITKTTAIIRELHVYSSAVAIGDDAIDKQVQHRGFGRALMQKAEAIAKKHNYDKMLVISGIGAKEYYKKLGYDYDGVYMGKKL